MSDHFGMLCIKMVRASKTLNNYLSNKQFEESRASSYTTVWALEHLHPDYQYWVSDASNRTFRWRDSFLELLDLWTFIPVKAFKASSLAAETTEVFPFDYIKNQVSNLIFFSL